MFKPNMVAMSLRMFITGRPGIGKTTVFMRTVSNLRKHGYIVGGIICPEIRGSRGRLGFHIVDILADQKGVLAYVCRERSTAPRVGKYCINVSDAINIGAKAINNALKVADVIGIDEVGPMELKVPQLRLAIYEALRSAKPTVAVVHYRVVNDLVKTFRNAKIYEVSYVNRELLPQQLTSELLDYLKRTR
ncbi:MAG: NTPase [Desulfurococcales archaeon]|nr:NTPase [Desulfurococcales archaeon]